MTQPQTTFPKRSLSVIALFGALTLPAQSFAAELSFTPESELKQICSEQGGTFIPSGGGSKVFACLHDNGVLIVCGGEGKYATTCNSARSVRGQIDLQRLSKVRNATAAAPGLATGN